MSCNNPDINILLSIFEETTGIKITELTERSRSQRISIARSLLTVLLSLYPNGLYLWEMSKYVGRKHDVMLSLWGSSVFAVANYGDISKQFHIILDKLDEVNFFNVELSAKPKYRTRVIGWYDNNKVVLVDKKKNIVIDRTKAKEPTYESAVWVPKKTIILSKKQL